MVINEKFFVGFVFYALVFFYFFPNGIIKKFYFVHGTKLFIERKFAKKFYYNQLGSFFNSVAVIGVSFPFGISVVQLNNTLFLIHGN